MWADLSCLKNKWKVGEVLKNSRNSATRKERLGS